MFKDWEEEFDFNFLDTEGYWYKAGEPMTMKNFIRKYLEIEKKKIVKDILNMSREAVNEKEAISPLFMVSVTYEDKIIPSPEWNIRPLQFVKIFDIEKYAQDNKINIL